MKETLEKQFDFIRKLIKLNIESINSLIEQPDSLKRMIENTELPLNDAVKKNLSEIRASMVESINSLIVHTDDLFSAYDSIIDTLSSK